MTNRTQTRLENRRVKIDIIEATKRLHADLVAAQEEVHQLRTKLAAMERDLGAALQVAFSALETGRKLAAAIKETDALGESFDNKER